MGEVVIRNLDEQTIDALKAQAKANKRSLEAELHHVLIQKVNPRLNMAVFRERTARIANATTNKAQTDSVELLRQDRDR